MSHLFHLTSLLVLLFNFSGSPLSTPVENIIAEAPTEARLPEETEEFIPWIEERKLTWEDFQSEPKKNTDAVASASTSLGIAYQLEGGNLTYKITCNFSKIKSWGLVKTPYILAHEQGHFDLTEISARLLHKALMDYQFNRRTFKQDINRIYDSIVAQKEALQAAYDGETDHSRNKRNQYDWLDKIDIMLEETAAYSSYP